MERRNGNLPFELNNCVIDYLYLECEKIIQEKEVSKIQCTKIEYYFNEDLQVYLNVHL